MFRVQGLGFRQLSQLNKMTQLEADNAELQVIFVCVFHTSAYVSMRRHTSLYVSIRQHMTLLEADYAERQVAACTSSLRPHTLVA